MLHGGGKFGGDGYKVSGGLHGVGVSVVNALSERLVVEVDRDGKRHRMEFANGGKPQTKLEVVGNVARAAAPAPPSRSGPTRPCSRRGVEFVARTILERLQMMAFLNKGLEIRFTDERPEHEHEGHLPVRRRHHRLRQAPQRLEGGAVQAGRLLRGRARRTRRSRSRSSGTPATTDGIHCFANGITTTEGGMHEEGFRAALTTVVNKYARAQEPPEGEGRQPPRRGHPRGPHRHHLGAPARPAVRGPDQGQARQRRDQDRSCRRPPTRSWPTGSRRTPPRPTRS